MIDAWEKQKQFVADASHELKTPLSIINANCSALYATKEETIESQGKWLNNITIGTDRMAKLINGLLALAKVEDNYNQLKKTQFDLSPVIDDVVTSMEAAVQVKDIEISKFISPDITIISDSISVKQVIGILLDNAIKYTETGGYIKIILSKTKTQVTFSIRNSGKGISHKDLSKVFDRFYRVDESRSGDSGYGLGLSIAKATIERLDGKISAESIENEYTTFSFVLGQ